MKTFTLMKPGIACRDGKIQVGEPGRGRHLVEVPMSQGGEFAADGRLLSVTVPGEQAGELLVVVPDLSGFRGSSSISAMDGCVEVARGACAQGDAGRMGGGAEYLLRVAPGGTFTVRRSGRRVEWAEGLFTNVNGAMVFCNPKKEAAIAAASSALFGAAPVIDPAIAAANVEREHALHVRDQAAKDAAEAVKRGVEAIHAETAALQRETWELENQARVVADNRRAREARDAAKAALGNGREVWGALDALKI